MEFDLPLCICNKIIGETCKDWPCRACGHNLLHKYMSSCSSPHCGGGMTDCECVEIKTIAEVIALRLQFGREILPYGIVH